MLKKSISWLLCCVLLVCAAGFAGFGAPVQAQEEPDADSLFVSLIPSDDTYIRRGANYADQNYGTVTSLRADVRSGSRAYPLLRFDAGEIKNAVDTASKVVFRFRITKEEYYSRFLVYPLYGAHREFDEDTITWSSASSIKESGVSLTDYLENPLPKTPLPEGDNTWQWYEVDVTEYVQSQTDYLYAFKLFGETGKENYVQLRSKEYSAGQPSLLFYTEVNYIVEQAASETLASLPVNSVTDDFPLPSAWDNSSLLRDECRIEWESSDESILRIEENEEGVVAEIFQRPDGADQTVELTMRILYRGEVREQKVNVLILRRGMVPLAGDTYTTGGTHAQQNHGKETNLYCGLVGMEELNREAYVQFGALSRDENESAERIILRLFPDNSTQVQSGTISVAKLLDFDGAADELTAESAAGYTEISDIVTKEFSCEKVLDIDVTNIIDRGGENVFKLWSSNDEIKMHSAESAYPAQLVVLDTEDAAMYDATQRIREEYLSGRDGLTADVSLPHAVENFEARWSGSDEEWLCIEDGAAVVTRPAYEDGDKNASLTLTLSSGTREFTYEYFVRILRSEPDGINGRRRLRDPMHVSDEDFFGKWNDTLGSYEKPPALQYDLIDGLSEVEYYARRGNYALAKEELLAYWRGRDESLKYEVKPLDSLSLSTRLATENIIGNQTPIATFSIGSEPQWHEISIPVSSGVRDAYMLFDRSKDGSTGVFYSQNTEYAPYLKVVTSSDTFILPCTADTYMEGMENSEKVNGTDALLLVHEAGNPFNSEAKRTYLNFDSKQLLGKGTVQAVSLMIYGRKMGGGSDEMKMIVYDAPLATYLDEGSAKWSDITPGTFNFNDCVYDWSVPYGSEAEWINSMARLERNVDMTAHYLATGIESSAAAALENAIGIYTYQEPGFPRALDAGWRTPALLATTFGLIDSEHMTAEVFCALIKYAYEMLQFMDSTSTPSVVNQMNAVDTGYTRLVIYYPELHDASHYEKSRARHEQTFSSKIMHSDGAYKEATTGYVHRVIAEMQEVVEMYEKAGLGGTEEWKEYAHSLASFYGNSFFPNGEMVPYGDSGRGKNGDLLWQYGEFFDDDMLRYQSKMTEMQEPQEYRSKLFPVKKLGIMRDGWDEDSLFATITAETGHSHGHPDDLHMDIYAYGRPLLIDAGNGGGYNPLLPAGVVRTETYPHNTVEINGKAQSYDVGENGMDMVINGTFDRAVGFAETNVGYRHTRKVFFLHGGFWIVSDVIVPEDDAQSSVYRQNWHPDNDANLAVDPQTGKAQTHFAGTANLTILQADMDKTETEIKQSYIKDVNLVNRMEDYVSYQKTTDGTAVFDTLLFPTEAGKDADVTFARLPIENTQPETASAMKLTYPGRSAVYYLSNEETPEERSFGGYTYDGELAYIEKNTDDAISYLALVNGSRLTDEKGTAIVESDGALKDISIKKNGSGVIVNTSEKLGCDVRIRVDGAVSSITLNGTAQELISEDGMLVLRAEQTSLPVVVDGTRMSYTFPDTFVKTLALTEGEETKKVTLTIPKGTKVSAALGWDGLLNFSLDESDQLSVYLDANQPLAFDGAVTIDVPFYSSSGAYYISGGTKRSFGDGKAEIAQNTDGCAITTKLGGEFVFTKRIGALDASGSLGKGDPSKGGGGSGGSGGGAVSPVPSEQPTPPDQPGDTENIFTDISGHWAEESIYALKEKGIISGDGDGAFRPDDTLTRAEFVKMLVCAVGEGEAYEGGFTDISGGEWYAPYVQAAARAGFVNGYADGSFRPGGAVTREESAKMLILALGGQTEGADGALAQFADGGEVSGWALAYMEQAVVMGIFKGTDDGKIEPKAELTRAMAAAVLDRLLSAAGQGER